MTTLLDSTARTSDRSAPSTGTTGTARPRLSRWAVVALVGGAALNTAQAVLMHALGSGDSSADRLADVDARPTAVLVMVLVGLLGVVLLLPGLQAVARLVQPDAPRAAAVGRVLAFLGTLGFLGMHVLMLVQYALAGLDDRAAAVTALDHLDAAPLLLVVFAPFLLGMFGGLLALVVGLLRTRGVPRWVPVSWAVFLVLDLTVAGVSPVDPHWLFLAGAVGTAVCGRRPTAKS